MAILNGRTSFPWNGVTSTPTRCRVKPVPCPSKAKSGSRGLLRRLNCLGLKSGSGFTPEAQSAGRPTETDGLAGTLRPTFGDGAVLRFGAERIGEGRRLTVEFTGEVSERSPPRGAGYHE